MEFEEKIELIDEYTTWKAQRKLVDTSAEAFIRDRTKEVAYGKLVEIDKYVSELVESYSKESDEYMILNTIREFIND